MKFLNRQMIGVAVNHRHMKTPRLDIKEEACEILEENVEVVENHEKFQVINSAGGLLRYRI